MFRIPSLAEILGVFISPKSVQAAVAGIAGAVKRLDDVVDHHLHHADTKYVKAGALRSDAEALDLEAKAHQDEATRAARVAGNLRGLVA